MENHKAGFVNIIGNPNVGKSTLMNSLVGERLSIITPKSQTTRHRIMGIVNSDDFQIVYSDTPGILEPKYKLQESMLKFVSTALTDADLLIYVTDVFETIDKHEAFLERIKNAKVPILLVLNKIDLVTQERLNDISVNVQKMLPNAELFMISALHKFNLEKLLNRIIELLPFNPPFFDKEELTDKPLRFFVGEIIREKIFLLYKQEIPYSCEVVIEEFKEEEKIIRIAAVIYVARDSQKSILIGKEGSAIKKLGIASRKEIEAFLGKQIFLETFVKVSKEWRDNENTLKNFGYLS